jgi:hypothetical protein
MSDRATALWRRFAGIFGHETLARKYGDTPPEEWSISIDRLAHHELERGMKRLMRSGKVTVPSLPEFLRMCREVGSDQYPDENRVPLANRLERQQPRWDREGCIHLLNYIRTQAGARVYYLGHDSTQPLVDAKNNWAQDMRDAEQAGALPADNGKQWWAEYIEVAEQRIRGISADYAGGVLA